MVPVLHYAPDNASLVIPLALEHLGLPYETRLVDRRSRAQKSAAYLALNPAGRIPVLETDEGPVFETAAILIWLDDRHGGLMPRPRGASLSWLLWLANTLHPLLIDLFYPDRAAPEGMVETAQSHRRGRIDGCLDLLDAQALPDAVALDAYLCAMLRWLSLYPVDGNPGLDLRRWPSLHARAAAFETTDASRAAARAEGLGPYPCTDPRLPDPPEGSAT